MKAVIQRVKRALFSVFLRELRAQHPRVQTGFFQEHMEVELVNDGPVTFILERPDDRRASAWKAMNREWRESPFGRANDVWSSFRLHSRGGSTGS